MKRFKTMAALALSAAMAAGLLTGCSGGTKTEAAPGDKSVGQPAERHLPAERRRGKTPARGVRKAAACAGP